MEQFDPIELKKLYIPSPDSHKGQNGKLLIIGGSKLFHAASLWALLIATRIVDMVFYSSVQENNQIVKELKKEFRSGIVVPRIEIENYIEESDAILIGPGMVRSDSEITDQELSLKEIINLPDEGIQSYFLTKYLLKKYPHKKWIIDAGALQMMKAQWLQELNGNVIITPHPGEFVRVFNKDLPVKQTNMDVIQHSSNIYSKDVSEIAKKYNCIILLKGKEDIVCSPHHCISITGGNAGMTKGGTGDVLAGLVAALSCKNEMQLAAKAGSFFNKKAGEALFNKVGYYFNASDLAEELPVVIKKYL